MKIVQTEVKDFFEGLKAKRHPPPKEKVDPVKAKRTIDALRKLFIVVRFHIAMLL